MPGAINITLTRILKNTILPSTYSILVFEIINMFTIVAGNTDVLAVTTLSVILLIMSLIMGLKIHWFRARMNMKETKSSSELGSLVGMYRSQPFEVSSSTPLAPQPHNNVTASSSSVSPPSTQLSPSSSVHKLKINSQKKLPASSLENPSVGQSQPSKHKQKTEDGKKMKTKPASGRNPLSKPNKLHNSTQVNSLTNLSVGQSQPSDHKGKKEDGNETKSLFSFTKNPLSKPEKHNKPPNNSVQNPSVFAATGQSQPSNNKGKNADGNKSKVQSASSKNPIAKPEKHNQSVDAKRPPDNMGQSMKSKSKDPAPKGILQKVKPLPLPTTDDYNASSLKLTCSSTTSLKLTDNSSVTLRQTDHSTPLKLTAGNSSSLKPKTPIPLYILEQEESESES
jgi:hypothetical protein